MFAVKLGLGDVLVLVSVLPVCHRFFWGILYIMSPQYVAKKSMRLLFVLFCSFHLCSCYGITVIRIQSKPSRVICRSCGPWYSECPPSLITRMVVRRQLCVDQWKHRKAGICQPDHACNVEILDPRIENDWGWLTDWKQAKKQLIRKLFVQKLPNCKENRRDNRSLVMANKYCLRHSWSIFFHKIRQYFRSR